MLSFFMGQVLLEVRYDRRVSASTMIGIWFMFFVIARQQSTIPCSAVAPLSTTQQATS
jgi:hypothetical protein